MLGLEIMSSNTADVNPGEIRSSDLLPQYFWLEGWSDVKGKEHGREKKGRQR